MSNGPEAAQTASTASPQLPSIRVTSDDDRAEARSANGSVAGNENGQTHGATRNHSRRLPRRHTLYGLVNGRGIVAIAPHFIAGLILIAAGCAIRSITEAKRESPHTSSSPQVRADTGNLSNSPLATPGGFQKIKSLEFVEKAQGLRLWTEEQVCEALNCSPHFPLICIAAGCVLILCSFSGALMLAHKMKEYVCCHLLWVSIATLSSAVLVAACAMGWNSAYERANKGFVECVSIVIIATSVEIVFCFVDLYCLSDYFSSLQGEHNMSQRNTTDSNRGQEPRSTRGSANSQQSDARQHPSETPTSAVRNARQRRSPALAVNANRRNTASHGYHGRRRRSGQAAMRDRNLLHPGYHHQTPRNRTRRRPILRAQNHYVLLPAAYSRSRAQSRAGRIQRSEERNRADMPMFVIANHDRYVQALNQSMENLERETNRGSVPGDVLPSAITHASKSQRDSNGIARRDQRNVLEKTDSVETTLSSSSMDSSKVIQAFHPYESQLHNYDKVGCRAPAAPDNSAFASQESAQFRRARDESGYSVVLRTKKGMKVQSHQHSASDASCDVAANGVDAVPAFLASQHAAMSRKFHRVASATEDSVFQQPELAQFGSSTCVTDSEYTPRGSEHKSNQHKSVPLSRARFYNTASEGDFSNIGATSSACRAREQKPHASVSSDSGILDGPGAAGTRVPYGSQRKHYYNVPMQASPKTGLQMRDFSGSNPHFSFSPVSPLTPSYENLHARAGIGSEENFVFEEQNDGEREQNES